MKIKFSDRLSRSIGNAQLQLKKHMPAILHYGGMASVAGGFIAGCVASTKLEKNIDETKARVDEIKKKKEESPDTYTDDIYKKDLLKARTEGALKIVKSYAPGVGCTVAGLACMHKGYSTTAQRGALLATAYAGLQAGFMEYRERVKERFGEDEELSIRVGSSEVTVTKGDEHNRPIRTTEHTCTSNNNDPVVCSQYARFFEADNPLFNYVVHKTVTGTYYEADTEENFATLLRIQNALTSKLRKKGHLFLNEAYDALRMPRSKAGQYVGWIYDPLVNPEKSVDFGLFDGTNYEKRRFVNGLEEVVLLDFNVDGDIINDFLKGDDNTWIG